MIGWIGGNSRGRLTFGVANRLPPTCLGCLTGIVGLMLLLALAMVL